jgi:hypothetical protein
VKNGAVRGQGKQLRRGRCTLHEVGVFVQASGECRVAHSGGVRLEIFPMKRASKKQAYKINVTHL